MMQMVAQKKIHLSIICGAAWRSWIETYAENKDTKREREREREN